jgi:type VI secretion system VasD/TssJ family lipoprotein
MMCKKRWAAVFLATLLLAACGPKPAVKSFEVPQNAASPEMIQWTYMPGGLTVNLKADQDLNPFEDFSHNIMLCAYQLSGPEEFQALADGTGGIRKLLECTPFDRSVIHAQRHFISPGQASALVMDRAEGARYLGLVAGYNDIQPGRVTLLYAFPVNESRRGWPPWSKVYNPGKLIADILLDTHSIQRIGVE